AFFFACGLGLGGAPITLMSTVIQGPSAECPPRSMPQMTCRTWVGHSTSTSRHGLGLSSGPTRAVTAWNSACRAMVLKSISSPFAGCLVPQGRARCAINEPGAFEAQPLTHSPDDPCLGLAASAGNIYGPLPRRVARSRVGPRPVVALRVDG